MNCTDAPKAADVAGSADTVVVVVALVTVNVSPAEVLPR